MCILNSLLGNSSLFLNLSLRLFLLSETTLLFSKASLVLAVTGLGLSETAHAFRKLFLRSWTVFAPRTCSYGFKTVIVSCVLVPSESVVAFSNCSRFSDGSRPKKQPSKVSRSVYCCVRFSSSI